VHPARLAAGDPGVRGAARQARDQRHLTATAPRWSRTPTGHHNGGRG
jgi:hypothetical protein